MRYLTFALAKGRLANKSLDLFEKIGITCEEMKDKDTRKLIFTNEELGYRFFLAKANDVPTYVEYGAADIGIVGKDTILEEGRKLYEVLDLKLGKCRMCVCGPESARELLQHHELIRVATKYPAIAKDYFYGTGTDDAAGNAEIQHIFYCLCAADTAAQLNRNGNAGYNGPDGILVHGMSGQRAVQIHNVEERCPLADPELCHVSRGIGVYFYVVK